MQASVVLTLRPSCSMACGIFLDQEGKGSPHHCKVDTQPLDHQGSPPGELEKLLMTEFISRDADSIDVGLGMGRD